jgi:hypothetical protein
MLIVALVMAVIGLAALVTAVVTSNEVIAWVCIAASVIGVVLLIIDALRERARHDAEEAGAPAADAANTEAPKQAFDAEYPEESASDEAPTGIIADEAPTEAAAEDSGDTGRRSG